MKPLYVSKSQIAYKTPYYSCYEQYVDFGNFSKRYYVVNFNKTSAVICLNNLNEVLLTKQYRFLINRISFEIAGGGLEDGESYQSAARRELFEEANVEALNLISLCKYSPGLDNVDNFTEIFLCKDFIIRGPVKSNESEILDVSWIHIDKCIKLIQDMEIQDAASIIAIALAKNYLTNNNQK